MVDTWSDVPAQTAENFWRGVRAAPEAREVWAVQFPTRPFPQRTPIAATGNGGKAVRAVPKGDGSYGRGLERA